MELTYERIGDVAVPYKLYSTDTGWIINSYKVEGIYTHGGSNGERLLKGDKLKSKFDTPNTFNLQYNERALINTGLLMHCKDHDLSIRSLVEMAWLNGIIVVPGTVFTDYRKEINVVIVNTSRQTQNITLGEPIVRVVPVKVDEFELKEGPVQGSQRPDNSLVNAAIDPIDPFNAHLKNK